VIGRTCAAWRTTPPLAVGRSIQCAANGPAVGIARPRGRLKASRSRDDHTADGQRGLRARLGIYHLPNMGEFLASPTSYG